jgi:predicted porin
MKKTLVALAALAAVSAFAQSTVTLKGTFDPSVAYTTSKQINGAELSNTAIRNNSQGTSQITFTGVEDLGGGLKAMFLYEGDFTAKEQASATNGIGNGGGEQYAGVSGDFGSIKLGAPNLPTLDIQAARQPFGTKLGSGFSNLAQGVLGTGHVRESNSLVYASPNFSGFSAKFGYSFNATATVTSVTVPGKSDLGLFYSSGPLAGGVTFFRQSDQAGGVTGQKQTNMYVSYALGAATLILGYHNEDFTATTAAGVSTTTSNNGKNIAAKYALSPSLTLLGNYGKLSTGSANADKKIAAFGARYDLSKRTSVYARYVAEGFDSVNGAATFVSDIKTTLVGIQHNF